MPVTDEERDAILDECIRRVVSVKNPRDWEDDPDMAEAVDTALGAACFRIMVLKSGNEELRRIVDGDNRQPADDAGRGVAEHRQPVEHKP